LLCGLASLVFSAREKSKKVKEKGRPSSPLSLWKMPTKSFLMAVIDPMSEIMRRVIRELKLILLTSRGVKTQANSLELDWMGSVRAFLSFEPFGSTRSFLSFDPKAWLNSERNIFACSAQPNLKIHSKMTHFRKGIE
jgi:hypothetical protein